MIGRGDVLAARERISGRVQRTPTFRSTTLSSRVGAECHLKAELFQKTGSFKPRGVLNVLASLGEEERSRGVIGISAGNHAQALAWGAASEGLDALLVTWQGVSEAKIDATRGYGAAVDLEASSPGEAFERLHVLIAETGRALVHPFDDPRGIAGAGAVGLEVEEDVPGVTVVVVPVGGGGLVTGIAAALAPRVRVVAVEPEGSAALHTALEAGRSVPIEPCTIAGGLDAPFAGAHAVEVCSALAVESVLVTDEEIEEGMRFLYSRAKLACEPAGAAAVGALLAGRVGLDPDDTIVAVVSGGNVAARTASAILAGR